MGIFKQVKELKASVTAPEMTDLASQLGSRHHPASSTNQSARHAADHAWRAHGEGDEEPDFEPIAGVSLERYVDVSKSLAACNHDQSKAADVAASMGITRSDWSRAAEGWRSRLRSNPHVGQRFSALYTAA